MKQQIKDVLQQKLESLQQGGSWKEFELPQYEVERPKDYTHGDYTVNLGFVLAKEIGKSPLDIANEISSGLVIEGIEEIDVVGGYINFTLGKSAKIDIIQNVLIQGNSFGKNTSLKGKKIMMEYTDPNPFKIFHVGHLMTNIIGESVATLTEFSGAQIVRANYQGDVGRHVAMAIWGMKNRQDSMPSEGDTLDEKVAYLGQCYAEGNKAFEETEQPKNEILVINREIYEKSNAQVNELYEKGRSWSLEKFEEIYAILGTKFDEYFFESQTWEMGKKIVEENTPGVYEVSDGATIFDGEKYDLHKRVFINSQGLTTYEAKDVGLAFEKRRRHECDQYINVTAVEQNLYFQVVFKSITLVEPWFKGRLANIPHGLLQLTSGKMSSRTGNVISGVDMIDQAQKIAQTKVGEKSDVEVTEDLINAIAVGGIKFSILKQAPGKNSIYNPDEALSFEGDSGPYLQYTYARIQSVIKKAEVAEIYAQVGYSEDYDELIYLLSLFPEYVHRSAHERAPHHIANYLLDVARTYNSFYAAKKIVGEDKGESASHVALTEAVAHVLQNGLEALGIKSPKKM